MNAECNRELTELLTGEIKKGLLPGAAIAVYQNGKELESAFLGYRDLEHQLPVERDTIFRIYSMTKPITAVAAKILQERGLLHEADPVSRYLPEFAKCSVLVKGERVPLEREIRISDLLTMTSGLVYPDCDEAGSLMQEVFDEIHEKICEGKPYHTRQIMEKIADSPLAFQPGKRWRYGLSTDALGGVIEVISGMSLRMFYQKEILGPLGMEDTDFYVPEEKQNRLASLYKREQGKLVIDEDRHLGLDHGLVPPAFESAGAGLYSTLQDYSKFVRMLAGKGIFEGVRILSEESVLSFQKNGLTTRQRETVDFDQLAGFGYGNFMRVRMEEELIPGKGIEGEFGWDGWTGPYFTVDVTHQFTFLYMVQISACDDWKLIWKIHNIIYSHYPS